MRNIDGTADKPDLRALAFSGGHLDDTNRDGNPANGNES